MAELAGEDDPRISSAGLTGAHYFLGRIDARSPGYDPGAGEAAPADQREVLIRRCSALMSAGGRDFRAAGEQLARRPGTI